MGTLSPDLGVLDARFVGAVWPLAAAGWPSLPVTEAEVSATSLAVGRDGLAGWALTMAALGLCLAGVMPFRRVIVGSVAPGAGEGDLDEKQLDVLLATEGPEVVRIALLGGGLDLERAQGIVAILGAALTAVGPASSASGLPASRVDPGAPLGPEALLADNAPEPPNAANVALNESPGGPAFWQGIDAAFAAGRPGEVLVWLAARVADGLDPGDTRDLAALAPVLLGGGALPQESAEAPVLAVDGEGR